jgi:hypothetical protein
MDNMEHRRLGERTDYLDDLKEAERQIGDMENEEVTTRYACSLSCKICQCTECSKIGGELH